ncbi:HlyD family secretion protein [Pseudomonas sp.]|uniref:HlyD family secretion protein n=1 Tax=Pseudomonas sp. TaxID=306 RepID=UPI00258FAA32|nr:HlyD family secretion protein [Pseudomonas sp.]
MGRGSVDVRSYSGPGFTPAELAELRKAATDLEAGRGTVTNAARAVARKELVGKKEEGTLVDYLGRTLGERKTIGLRALMMDSLASVEAKLGEAYGEKIRDSEYQYQVEQREAQWQALLAAAGRGGGPGALDSQVLGAVAMRQAAQAALAQSSANLEQARNDYGRARRLGAQGVLSTQDLEVAKARFDALSHAQEVARGNAQAAAQSTLANKAELKVQDYRIAAAQAELEQARIKLHDTRQTAPVRSIVSKKEVEPGQFVVAGQKLLSLIATDPLWITANFKETQVGRVRVGQLAKVTVDAFPGQAFDGVVESLAPATGAKFSLLPQENATGNFTKVVQRVQVRIALKDVPDDYKALLSPGMSAFVEVATQQHGSHTL